MKLEIKVIKGHKYLYFRDKVKVNDKSAAILLYVGRLSKLERTRFIEKLSEFEKIKLKRYVDSRLKKYQPAFLNKDQTLGSEVLRYWYLRFREIYPDEFKHYSQAVFVHYAHGTTAIEGNTITQRQVEELFEHSIAPAGKTVREIHELINFKDLERFFESYEGDVSEKLIKKMHTIIMRNLSNTSGEYRRIQVWIEKEEYVPPPPFEISALMKELIKWYRANKRKLPPLELAIILHTKIVTIHPFVDGNGRLGRALLNFVLRRNGYPTLSLDLVHREKYLDVVAEGNKDNYKPIIDFICEIYVPEHKKIADEISKKLQAGELEEHKRLIREFSMMERNE